MIGDAVRDKDAVVTGAMLCEVAAWAKAKGSSFYEELISMYAEYGFFREALVSLVKKGKDGAEQIASMMERFRTDTPTEIAGSKVVEMRDYKKGEIKNFQTGETSPTNLPGSHVIQFYLEDGSKVTARPSGTEPKIKFYFSLQAEVEGKSDFEEVKERVDARIEELKEAFISA